MSREYNPEAILNALEPEVTEVTEWNFQMSAAISLKRIADQLSGTAKGLTIWDFLNLKQDREDYGR